MSMETRYSVLRQDGIQLAQSASAAEVDALVRAYGTPVLRYGGVYYESKLIIVALNGRGGIIYGGGADRSWYAPAD